MRLHPEKPACPRRGNATAVQAVLGCRQPERGGKGCWDAEQPDRDLPSRWQTRIASEALGPREARVRALRTGEDHRRDGRRSGGRRQAHFEALVSHELDTGAPVCSAAPIAPEQWGRTYLQRMKQHTDLARLCGGVALPLALLSQRAGPTAADASSIHHAQAAVGFSAVFMRQQRLVSRTSQRPIGLESKVLA